MTRDTFYFAYGTLQRGFANHARFASDLGEPLGRFRTANRYPLVVARRAACSNPGCPFLHRMAVLLPDRGEGLHVEGEVYAVSRGTIDLLDRLESYVAADEAASAHVRRSVRVVPVGEGDSAVEAQTYFAASSTEWRELLARGEGDLVASYGGEVARAEGLKECCRKDPEHDGPHDVVPLLQRERGEDSSAR